MDKRQQLNHEKKQLQEEIYAIGEWLKNNIKDPDFLKKSHERNNLSVKVELINQKLKGRWSVIKCRPEFSTRLLNSYMLNK